MREKMSRQNRAKQFAPFDALKGLQEALRLKEYEHEKVSKGEISQEKAEKISNTLINLEKDNIVEITYFENGYYKTEIGKVKVDIYEKLIKINEKTINLNDLTDIFVK